MKYQDLDQRAKNIASRYKACEKELLQIISKLDQKKAFLHWGYSSLFSYVTKGLELSPAVACNFIAVARKSHEVPALKEQVLKGNMSVHLARKITPVLTKDNQELWLKKARTQTQRQLERDVSLVNHKAAVMEKSTYVSTDKEVNEKVKILQQVPRIQLQVGLSEKIMLKLRRAQDLESQRKKGPASLENTLDALLNTYLKKNDPIEKAKRQQMRGKLSENTINDKKEFKSTACSNIQPQKHTKTATCSNIQSQNHKKTATCSNIQSQNHKKTATCSKIQFQNYKKTATCSKAQSQRHTQIATCSNTQLKDQSKSTARAKSLLNSNLNNETHADSLSQTDKTIKNMMRPRKAIPARIRHQVQLRDQGQCTHTDASGQRCQSRRHLDIHHHRPVSKGGGDELTNLTLLCNGHHRSHHLEG